MSSPVTTGSAAAKVVYFAVSPCPLPVSSPPPVCSLIAVAERSRKNVVDGASVVLEDCEGTLKYAFRGRLLGWGRWKLNNGGGRRRKERWEGESQMDGQRRRCSEEGRREVDQETGEREAVGLWHCHVLLMLGLFHGSRQRFTSVYPAHPQCEADT